MEKTLKSSALNYGIYLGLIFAVLTVIGYAVYLDLFTQWWFGIGSLLLIIVFGIISSVKARKLLGGFISFKNAFTAYFITILVALVISTIVNLIIFNVVDPDAALVLKEKIIESQMAMMERFGAPQESIDQTIAQLRAQDNMFSIGSIFKSLAYQLVGFSIVGLIVAAVVKRKDPNAA
ncbi:DUF4199 domain-containing protein [Winogradskyella sp. A3E31]|uniref:DUF4199 domain-containing protein n=1 Tax=Winogradskyella sp. A3E31 TaxID=3349637 RepID=UPI00398A7475